jgi:hypothetical protein
MTKRKALITAKAMRAEGRDVQVAFQTIAHANSNGQPSVSFVYRVVENGSVVR